MAVVLSLHDPLVCFLLLPLLLSVNESERRAEVNMQDIGRPQMDWIRPVLCKLEVAYTAVQPLEEVPHT